MDWEADLGRVPDGTTVDLVAKVTFKGAGFALWISKIRTVQFWTDVDMGEHSSVTIFSAKKITIR